MAADGDIEVTNTIARARTLCGGRVWESFVPDDESPGYDASGKILPHIILDFTAPVRSEQDRNLANPELGQPHRLGLNAACIAGDIDTARSVSKDLFNLLVDWAPSDTADPYVAQGGYGSNRPATSNTPSRAIKGLFFDTTVNVTF